MKKMKGKMTRENEKRKQMSCVFEKRDSTTTIKITDERLKRQKESNEN